MFANVVNMSTGFNVIPLHCNLIISILLILSLKIFLHGPYEVSDCAAKNIYSRNGFFLQLYLTALSLFSSQRARELSVGQRKCRFHDESNLPHSAVYSYRLCKMECRIRLSKKLCGCMPHFYRHLRNQNMFS